MHKIHKIRGLHKLTKQKGSKRHKTAAWRLRFWGLSRVFCGLISLVRFDRSRHLCQEREELPAPRIDHGAHWQDPLPHHATLRSDAAGPARSYPLWMSGGVQEQGQHVVDLVDLVVDLVDTWWFTWWFHIVTPVDHHLWSFNRET